MKSIIATIAICLMFGILTGCDDPDGESEAQLHQVTLYGDTGGIVRTWVARGNVYRHDSCDRWEFIDNITGKPVSAQGVLVEEDVPSGK